ncbi:hypothetical protein R3P38DRAFT_752631 [Favolaschia claudopus]|uniref:Uncharacterized protein n=1 Tax=Favolaschia claudopus TaxID=2862362 RepID=A0AAV9Z3C3_9AGAR
MKFEDTSTRAQISTISLSRPILITLAVPCHPRYTLEPQNDTDSPAPPCAAGCTGNHGRMPLQFLNSQWTLKGRPKLKPPSLQSQAPCCLGVAFNSLRKDGPPLQHIISDQTRSQFNQTNCVDIVTVRLSSYGPCPHWRFDMFQRKTVKETTVSCHFLGHCLPRVASGFKLEHAFKHFPQIILRQSSTTQQPRRATSEVSPKWTEVASELSFPTKRLSTLASRLCGGI